MVSLLMPYLTGRTFSNPQERGDYPSQKYAVHTAESNVELLVRFTVDVYHNREHKSLEYSTPNLTWDSLVSEFGWSPPDGPTQVAPYLRHKAVSSGPTPQPEERSVFIDLDEDDSEEWVFSDELDEDDLVARFGPNDGHSVSGEDHF